MQESGNLAFNVITKQGDFVLDSSVTLGKDGKYHLSGEQTDIDKLMKNPGKAPFNKFQQKPVFQQTAPDVNSRPNLVETKQIMEKNR